MKRLGAYLFRKLGIRFVYIDYLIRTLKIASQIEIYDAANSIVNIDGKLMHFYPQHKFISHYQKYSKTGKTYDEMQKLLCPVEGLNIKF